jgi:hypothetical protein
MRRMLSRHRDSFGTVKRTVEVAVTPPDECRYTWRRRQNGWNAPRNNSGSRMKSAHVYRCRLSAPSCTEWSCRAVRLHKSGRQLYLRCTRPPRAGADPVWTAKRHDEGLQLRRTRPSQYQASGVIGYTSVAPRNKRPAHQLEIDWANLPVMSVTLRASGTVTFMESGMSRGSTEWPMEKGGSLSGDKDRSACSSAADR